MAVRDYLLRSLEHNGLGGVNVRGNVLPLEDGTDFGGTQEGDAVDVFRQLRTVSFTLYLNGGGLQGELTQVQTTPTAQGDGTSSGGQMLSPGLHQEQMLAMMTNPYPVWVPGMIPAYTRVQQQAPSRGKGYTAPVEPVERPVRLQQPAQVYIQQPAQVYVQQPVYAPAQQPVQQYSRQGYTAPTVRQQPVQQYSRQSYAQQPVQSRQSYAQQPVQSRQSYAPARQPRQRGGRYPVDQTFAIKTNLPYWLALAPNAGIEFYMGPVSIAIEGTLSYWEKSNTTGNEGIYIAEGGAEFRYWFQRDRRYGSHVIGAYGQFGEFDIKLNEIGRQGSGFGGGISYNYYLPVSSIFAFEFGIGLGALSLKYDVYQWDENAQKNLMVKDKRETYVGPTKIKAALILRIGNKVR